MRSRYLTGAATVLGAQLGRIGLGLILEMLYARLLGPAGRGQLSLCSMIIGVGVLVGGVGGEIPIMLWSANPDKQSADWLPSVLVNGCVGALVASVLWAILFWRWHPSFLRGITDPMAVLVLISIPLSIVFVYGLATLTGNERFSARSYIILANQVVVLSVFVALTLLFVSSAEMAMVASVIGLLAAILLIGASSWGQNPGSWKHWTLSRMWPAISLGMRGQLGNLATFLNYRLDVFVVNYFLSPAQVGIYAVGVLASEALWQIPDAAALALIPRIARMPDRGSAEFTCFVTRQVSIWVCITGLILAVAAPKLIPLVFGAQFIGSVPVVWLILPGTAALAVGKVMSADLTGRGMPEYSSMFAFASLVLTAVLDLILIPRWGIQGAAIASSAAYLLDAFLVAWILQYKLRISWKSMYVPTRAEFSVYLELGNRLLARLRPSTAG